MRFTRTLLTTVALAFVTLPCLADEPAKVATQPSAALAASKSASVPVTSSVSMVPDEVIKQIEARFQTRPTIAIAQGLVKMCEDAEKQYAAAGNLYLIQAHMLQAQAWIAAQSGDQADQKKMIDIAKRIFDGNAPAAQKFAADTVLTISKIQTPTGEIIEKDAAAKEIRGIVSRYEKTDVAANAVMLGIRLSDQAGLKALVDEYSKLLAEKYPTAEGAKSMLRDLDKGADTGKSFEAELTKLDGGKLSLPKDLLDNVVVIDFWATWCPPCRASIPHMKEVYAKYKNKGVVFVGISLDQANGKTALEKFVKDQGIGWVQTYSGKYWEDPTARKYGVRAIPSVWVIGKNGKVVSENARANLEETLDKALRAQTATKPAASAPAGK